MLDLVFQALPIFLVDYEKVGGILLPTLTAHELATKSLLRSPNESIVLGNNFLNHDLTNPFKFAKKDLHITSSKYPYIIIKFLYEYK